MSGKSRPVAVLAGGIPIRRLRKKAPRGRPTTYQPEYVDLAFFHCSRGFFTDALLARALGVHWSRISGWRKKYSLFSEAVRAGTESYIINRLLTDPVAVNTTGIIAVANNVLGWVFRKAVEEHRVREYSIDVSGLSVEERDVLRKMTPDERRRRMRVVSGDSG